MDRNYQLLKGKYLNVAQKAAEISHGESVNCGFKDVYHFIMSDKTFRLQARFFLMIYKECPVDEKRRYFLDELSKEFDNFVWS